jgi:3-hydroxyacyl-CoA dehydrogenase/3-hydroxy-2-methylbutyryl-CoA dehydrogenase
MTLPMARDLARHAIRVVTIAPGVFASAMTSRFSNRTRMNLENEGTVFPVRFGRPEEFAQTVKWVLECPYVNGETVRLSGAGRLPGKL